MSDGVRDGFFENDNYGVVTSGVTSLVGHSSSSSKKKRKKHNRKVSKMRRHKRQRKYVRSKRRHKKSSRGIKYTKRGQPYKIMPNGRARFLKK